MIDGEAVILGADGVSDFNAPHSGKHGSEVQLCAFDVLAIDGDDLRELPLTKRKVGLERLLKGRADAIFMNPFEVGAGPDLFRAQHGMGGLGIQAQRSAISGGRSLNWIEAKNRNHHAFDRVREAFG